MKITIENDLKSYFVYKIIAVCIEFDDGCKTKLDQISQYDFDFNNDVDSIIMLTNILNDREIENRFRGKESNRIIHINMDMFVMDPIRCEEYYKASYDIPCDMKIRRLKCCWSTSGCDNMSIELVGVIK